MRFLKLSAFVTSLCLLAVGTALADKSEELAEFELKPWRITDLPVLNQILADVNETEPLNDTCPGEPYALGDVVHAAVTAGNEDWYCFNCSAGDLLTIGTDSDGTPTVDTVIELYANDCVTLLTSNDDGGPGLYSLIDGYEIPADGAYYLKVRGYGATSAGLYQMTGNCVTPEPPASCPLGQYKASKIDVNQDIPDNDPAGLVTPAIKFNPQPGKVIADVVIDLEIEHTWVGDLVVTLKHTSSGGVVTSVNLLQQPGVPESTFGCAGDLIGDPEAKYYFRSTPGLDPLGEFDCPSEIPAMCYEVAIENLGGLAVFQGNPVGDGTWELCVFDNAAGDTGHVYNWSVHILTEDAPISVEEESWGSIKAKYASE